MRAVSVAKYQPPASSSAVGPVGDHAPVGEQHRPRRRTSAANSASCVATSTAIPCAARSRSQRGELGLRGPVHAPRRLVEREHRGRLAAAEHDRQREALALAAGEVARVALGERAEPGGSSAAAGASSPTRSCRK